MNIIRKPIVAAIGAVAIIGGALFGTVAYDRPAEYIVGHHQAGTAWTKREQAVSFFKAQGYADIAYNALITPSGEVWKGRDEAYIGGSNKGLNARAVSFCWLGNLDKAEPTDAQIVAAGLWIRSALKRHPGAKLIGHGDVARVVKDPSVATGCPGKAAIKARSLRAAFLIASGYPLAEAKRRAKAGL